MGIMEKLDKYFDFYEENPHENEEPDEVVETALLDLLEEVGEDEWKIEFRKTGVSK